MPDVTAVDESSLKLKLKSVNFRVLLWIKIFAGLISLWIIFYLNKVLNASNI